MSTIAEHIRQSERDTSWQGSFLALLDAIEERRAERQNREPITNPSISPSFISTALQCPEKLRQKYVLGVREPWGGSAIVGLAVHRSAELNYAQKVISGVDVPVGDIRDLTATAFDEKVLEAERDGIEWGDTDRGRALDTSVGLATAYHTVAAPRVQPVAVEEKVSASVHGVPLAGRIDVRTATSTPDVKTTRGKMTDPRPDWRIKGMLYSAMTGLDFEWHVVTRTNTPAVWTPHEAPGLVLPAASARMVPAIIERVGRDLGGYFERYTSEQPWPSQAMGVEFYSRSLCDYCSFRSSCAHWEWER